RPCLPVQQELIQYREQLDVFRSLPGITGLAQVRGIDMSRPELCARTDAEYLQELSVWTDLKIILETFTGPFRGIRRVAVPEADKRVREFAFQIPVEAGTNPMQDPSR